MIGVVTLLLKLFVFLDSSRLCCVQRERKNDCQNNREKLFVICRIALHVDTSFSFLSLVIIASPLVL